MLFEQELDGIQRRALGPLHLRLVIGFNKRADRFEIVQLIRIEPVLKAEQRLDGPTGGGVVRDVMQWSRDITLAETGVILRKRREGFGAGAGSRGCFHGWLLRR